MASFSNSIRATGSDPYGFRPSRGDGKLLLVDADMFDAYFDRHPFKISHSLVNHPLLQLPRLVELARSLDRPILYFKGNQSINQVDVDESGEAKRTFLDREFSRPELSATETIAQIESCQAWLQIRDIGSDPEYAKLLAELIDEFRGPSERVAPGLSAPRADIFVSSPGATTPFHLDEEHNFLLQIRGTKRMSIANGFDPQVVDRECLSSYFRGNGELVPFGPHLEQQSTVVELSPGEGVHVPPCFPHWVQNGDAVSISLGVLWYSDVTARRRYLYRVNAWMEQAGLKPSEPGKHPVSDAIKLLPQTIKRRARRFWAR
jgi:hypothetical protein